MKTIRNKSSKAFGAALLLLLAIVLLFSYMGESKAFSQDVSASLGHTPLLSKKVYSEVSIDDDFDGDSLIVVLDKTISGANKKHKPEFFGGIEISEIVDLTRVYNNDAMDDIDENFEQILEIRLPVDSKQTVINNIKKLEKIKGIKFAGPNSNNKLDVEPDDPLFNPTNSTTGQWALEKVQATKLWDITKGSKNIRVGVIDTGLDWTHPDLSANFVGGADFTNMSGEQNEIPGQLRSDTAGHGTHVAGIIGAVGNNGIGISGANWNVSLFALQVASGGSGTISSVACLNAVNFAVNIWDTDERLSILNYSIGATTPRPDLEAAIRRYKGLFVCSTGNESQNNDITHHYPSFYASELHDNPLTNMIAVGRSDIGDNRPVSNANANWGPKTITLFAPGHMILSTIPYSTSSQEYGKGYGQKSGSSQATPLVAGVAALLLSINPNLTALQLKEAIVNTVDVRPSLSGELTGNPLCVTGGRLNAYKAAMYILYEFDEVSSSTVEITGVDYILEGDVEIPSVIGKKTVVSIGTETFRNQNRIESFSIPATIANIGEGAFAGCVMLTSITVDSKNKNFTSFEDSLYDISKEQLICYPGGKTGAIIFPEQLTEIGSYAFAYCILSENITLPNSVTNIGKYAFAHCNSLQGITLPEDMTEIGEYTFAYCGGLQNIALPDGVRTIGEYAFAHCVGLESIILPDGLETIGEYAFSYCSALQSIDLPADMTEIDAYAFAYCNGLKAIEFTYQIEIIGDYAFAHCDQLTEITITANISQIGQYAFQNCTKLEAINFEEGGKLREIANGAFYGCSSLEEIMLPYSVVSIGDYAFANCDGLVRAGIPGTTTHIGADIFADCINLADIITLYRTSGIAISDIKNIISYELTGKYGLKGKDGYGLR